jgi:DNA-binding transcriptional MerR regulator
MFTVSDIAEKIRRPDEDEGQAITRVRNWTKEGLLKPSGKVNPGSGRARKYSKATLRDAVLMQALVNAGISATWSSWLVRQIREVLPPTDQKESVLLLGQSVGSKALFMRITPLGEAPQMILEAPPHDVLTLVYLHRIFDRLEEAGE